jgi:hypothetical protein
MNAGEEPRHLGKGIFHRLAHVLEAFSQKLGTRTTDDIAKSRNSSEKIDGFCAFNSQQVLVGFETSG